MDVAVLLTTMFFCFFIGVPIALAILTFSDQHSSSRWLADLLGGSTQTKTAGL